MPDADGTATVPVQLHEDKGLLVLHLQSPYVRHFVLSTLTGEVLFEGGASFPGSQRRMLHPEFALPLAPGLPRELVLQVIAAPGVPVVTSIRIGRDWNEEAGKRFLLDGIYYGSMALMVLLAVGLAVFARDPNSFRLSATLLAWTVTTAAAQGYGGLFLWPDVPELNSQIAWFIVLAALTSAWFSKGFLADGGVLVDVTRRLLNGAMAVSFAVLVVGLVENIDLAALWVLGTVALIVLGGSIHAASRRDLAAVFLLGAAALAAAPPILVLIWPVVQEYSMFCNFASLVFVVLAVLNRFGTNARKSVLENELARARGRFLANLSHEMRTPLNAIVGYADLCTSAELNSEAKHLVARIDRSAKLLVQIVNDVLDFSKLEAGKLEMDLRPTDLRAVVADVAATVEPKADAGKVSMLVDVADTVPREVLADGGRCTQVLLNLVGNAVKFTPGGTVTIRVRINVRDEKLSIAVVDTGIGIDEEALGQLFNPYAQASATHASSGTGLGLAISKDLAVVMGGDIHVESEKGCGSCFTFEFPFREPPLPVDAQHVFARVCAGRVLVAEDNSVNRMLLRRMLETEGQSVEVVGNGRDAVRRISECSYDLVLMDMNMPVLDGVLATRSVRSTERGRRVPIVAMTGNATQADREQCLGAGMDDYLTKPLTREALNGVLVRYMGQAGPASDVHEPLSEPLL